MNQQTFTVALPSGRMGEESVEFLSRAGIANFDMQSRGRELSLFDKINNFRIVLVRSRDVPTYVINGVVDAGISGRDDLLEGNHDLTAPLELGFGDCRLCVAAPANADPDILSRPHLKVASKYPRMTMDYFYQRGVSCEIIKLHGSIELAPLLGMTDVIVDLVSSGDTLKANGLVEKAEIMRSCAMLVISRAAYALQPARIQELLAKFQLALRNGAE